MSAVWTNSDQPESTTKKFKLEVPIPSYLFAIVAGVFETHDLPTTSGVTLQIITESSMMEASVKDMEEIPLFLTTAEKIVPKYPWP